MVLHQGHDTEVCFVKLSTARASKKDQREKVYLLTQLFYSHCHCSNLDLHLDTFPAQGQMQRRGQRMYRVQRVGGQV